MSNANTAGSIARITREMAKAKKNNDLSIHVACSDEDVRWVRALIIGPSDTPYEFGFFEFALKFPPEYPIAAPKVTGLTTNAGQTRFNPNIYADGLVCLSILGTWRGEAGEQWSSAQGLESVLLSIQSLMSSNPYENEPGYERTPKDDKLAMVYVKKIRHETLRISVIKTMETLLGIISPRETGKTKKKNYKVDNAAIQQSSHVGATKASTSETGASAAQPDDTIKEYDAESSFHLLHSSTWRPFTDLLKQRFLWYYDIYMHSIDTHASEQRDKSAFETVDFEFKGNTMDGHFEYANLRERLITIRATLDQEIQQWVQKGLEQAADETQLATQLAYQLKQLKSRWDDGEESGSRLDLSLPDPKNPFVWQIALFGEASTNLDGGVFSLIMHIPPDFPNSQPRVVFETPIFHHRVSSNGVLCYIPQKEDEIASHLSAIVAAIDDKDTQFDPRTMVNPERFNMRWGSEADRKIYYRKLRRSAQDSSEFS